MSAIGEHHRGGSGEPLLLIHGYTATWLAWSPVIELLEEHFDVFAPTLGGHTGGPDLPEDGDLVELFTDGLEAMLDEVGWQDAHVGGFSLGGHLAFELAKRGRARTVTVIAPAGAFDDPPMTKEARRVRRMFARSHDAANRFAAINRRFSGHAWFRRATLRDMMVDGSRVPAEMSLKMAEAFAETPVFKRYQQGIGTYDLEDIDDLDVPVTVLWGDRDRVLPQDVHEPFFREHLPHAEFRTLKRAGHVPFWEATERIADAITQRARSK